MNIKSHYKVIIVGAGPSGLATALELFKNDIKDILVLEKYKFPRYKCCAGYITNKTKKAYKNFGLDVDNCHYSLIKDFKIFYKMKERQRIDNKFLYTNKAIDRVELDNAFFELAKSKGINIVEECPIIDNSIENKTVTIKDKVIEYDYLIFADGTLGYGARYQNTRKKNIAMQLVFLNDNKEEIKIHFGVTKRGYGWVSSYRGITNIGLTDVYDSKINYNEVFSSFLDSLNIDIDIQNLKGAFTPIGIGIPFIKEGSLYFVGDAVGACDPLTLSGLRYGLKSGSMCAKAITDDNELIYEKYINKLKIRFCLMEFLMKIFYLKPILFVVFNIGCKFFKSFISLCFNNFFVNKK